MRALLQILFPSLLLVICTGVPAANAQSGGVSIEDAKEHFTDAVVKACGDYFSTDVDLSTSTAGTSLTLQRMRAGSQWPGCIVTGMPVYQVKDSVVYIKENLLGATCEVVSYGLPVEATFQSIADELLSSDQGYVELPASADLGDKDFRRIFTRVFRDIEIKIVLFGNEPGAPGRMSRFSSLNGIVSFSSAEG